MKKALAIILSLILVLAISLPAAAITAVAPKATKAPALKPVTLKFYFMNDKKTATDTVWNAIGDKFKKQLNSKFKVNFIPANDYITKLMVMSSSGDNWDANYDGSWMAYGQMVAKGGYLPVNDLLPKYAPKLYKNLASMGTLDSVTSDGKIMAIPWTMKGNLHPFIVWRTDLLKKAGVALPDNNSIKTIADIDKFIDILHKAMPDAKMVIPDLNNFAGGNFDPYFIRDEYNRMDFHAMTFSMNDAKTTVIPIENAPFFKEGLKRLRTQYEKGLIAKDAMVDKTEASQYFNQGLIPYTTTTHEWALANQAFTDPNATKGYSELYPEKKFYNRSPTGNLMAINKNAANPERTMMYFELLETNQQLYDMVMYGIKGLTFEIQGQEAVYPKGMTSATSNYMGWGGQWSEWKPQFMRPDATYSAGFWKRESEFASTPNHIPSPIDGLNFDPEPIKNELAQRDQIIAELGRPLGAGVVADVDKAVDELTAKLKAAGSDKIAAELNKQVQAFIAAHKK